MVAVKTPTFSTDDILTDDISPRQSSGKNIVMAHPIKSALYGLILYLLILFILPLEIVHKVDLKPVLFVLCCYVFFVLGSLLAGLIRVSKIRPIFKRKSRSQQRLILAVCGLASVILVVADRFFARGVSLSGDWVSRREALLETSSSPAAIIGALLIPAVYLFLFSIFRDRRPNKNGIDHRVMVAILLCAAHPIIGLLLGSRSTLLTSLFFLVAIPLYFRQRPINWLLISRVFLIGIASILVFGATFLNRLDTMNMTAAYSAEFSVYAFTVKPTDWAVDAISIADGSIVSLMFFSVINLAQYYTHGLLELIYQVSNESQIEHSNGAFFFFIPYKLVSTIIPLPQVFDLIAASKTSIGAYTSFFGPIHSDFGWFAFVFMLVFGAYATRIFKIAQVHSGHVPLSILLTSTIFLFPVVNFLLLGVNFYVFVGFAIFASWSRLSND